MLQQRYESSYKDSFHGIQAKRLPSTALKLDDQTQFSVAAQFARQFSRETEFFRETASRQERLIWKLLLTSRDSFPRKTVPYPRPPLSSPSPSFWRFWLFSRCTRSRAHSNTIQRSCSSVSVDPGSRGRCQEIRTLAEEADSPRAHSSCYFRRVEL